jgi:hypothetical protein
MCRCCESNGSFRSFPRNYDRFREYLRTMQNRYGNDGMLAPLLFANPMAKDHVTALLDALLELDADGVAARAAAEAPQPVVRCDGFRLRDKNEEGVKQ